MHMRFDRHLSEEQLEDYCLGRMSEADCALAEEHWLVCPDCQDRVREMDEFIAALRVCTQTQRKPRTGKVMRMPPLPIPIWGAVCALVLSAVLVLAWPRPPHRVPYALILESVRGPREMGGVAPAGYPLSLMLNGRGLPVRDDYQAEIVDARGRQVLQQRLCGKEWLCWRLPANLKKGRYWVRLSADGELLREFGLLLE